MPRDLEDEIFGGESDLSDFDQDERPTEDVQENLAEEGRQHEEDDGGLSHDPAPREGSHTYPKFRKDTTQRSSEQSSAPKKKNQQRNKRPDSADNGVPPDDGEAEVVIDPEEQRRQELYQRIDEAAGKNKKGKRRRRKGGDEDLEMMADEEVSRLRTEMLSAADTDIQANEERRPATGKLMLLPKVKSTIQKSHLETAILDNGVLEAVKKWLEPLPDRSLPALNIQRELLELLSKMSIDTQSLKSSELGKIVLFYTKCPRVDPTIKRMADQLVTRWIKPILRRSARSREPIPMTAPRPVRPPTGGAPNSQRARIPETVHQVFHNPARSQLDSTTDGPGGSQNPAMRNSTQKATAKKTREWARKIQDARKIQRMG
ncbi:uncharacterized protein PGTG_11524 [Puccinia graminis f. sp. tritici CRL 75-36-700-3]|uniref:TFIIS N-terminal domain-containing protein n=1 Tax=Puccinia graminis f. sp. tritici (strain CRL 75-36-700-3 / race SCCL) TaxID=418459 RepID=E3KM06_PUCGT|nr:uncharacterized protein PGTG_11524 [Puccinia graminis f. sp. tritici CRL 75-36-700-3]EFP85355.2 hypothetical protein PGTG_11524 [Puccinia graminis f. sp. tritici CRL 75-36-700-3]